MQKFPKIIARFGYTLCLMSNMMEDNGQIMIQNQRRKEQDHYLEQEKNLVEKGEH